MPPAPPLRPPPFPPPARMPARRRRAPRSPAGRRVHPPPPGSLLSCSAVEGRAGVGGAPLEPPTFDRRLATPVLVGRAAPVQVLTSLATVRLRLTPGTRTHARTLSLPSLLPPSLRPSLRPSLPPSLTHTHTRTRAHAQILDSNGGGSLSATEFVQGLQKLKVCACVRVRAACSRVCVCVCVCVCVFARAPCVRVHPEPGGGWRGALWPSAARHKRLSRDSEGAPFTRRGSDSTQGERLRWSDPEGATQRGRLRGGD